MTGSIVSYKRNNKWYIGKVLELVDQSPGEFYIYKILDDRSGDQFLVNSKNIKVLKP